MERCEDGVRIVVPLAIQAPWVCLYSRHDRHASIEQDEQHDQTADESPE